MVKIMDSIRLYHCPFQRLERLAGIRPATVHAILTDIPYIKAFLPEIPALAAMGSRVLAEGGVFLTYSGQYYLDRVMDDLRRHLIYRWAACQVWDGLANRIWPRQVISKWKPILVFSKGTWRKRRMWFDVFHTTKKEKQRHPWGQPLAEAETLVHFFTKPGDLVLDPCGGGFTMAVACYRLGAGSSAAILSNKMSARGLSGSMKKGPPSPTSSASDRDVGRLGWQNQTAGLGKDVRRRVGEAPVDALRLHFPTARTLSRGVSPVGTVIRAHPTVYTDALDARHTRIYL